MNYQSQTTRVNDLVFPLLLAILGFWIYFLFPSDCFKNTGSTSIVPPTIDLEEKKKPVLESKSKKWAYSDRLEFVKEGPFMAGEEIEIVYIDKEIPKEIIWEIDELVVKVSKDQGAVLSHSFDQEGTYLIAAKNPLLKTIDTLMINIGPLDEAEIIGNKIANYTHSNYSNNIAIPSSNNIISQNRNSFSTQDQVTSETVYSEYEAFTEVQYVPSEKGGATTSNSNSEPIKNENTIDNAYTIVDPIIKANSETSETILKETSKRQDEGEEIIAKEVIKDIGVPEEAEALLSEEEKEIDLVELEELNLEEEEEINSEEEGGINTEEEEVIDSEEETVLDEDKLVTKTPGISKKGYSPKYFKEQNIAFLEEFNLETLLRTIAKRGNEVEDQKTEDEAQYALSKINNNLANDPVLLRRKVEINSQEKYLGTHANIQDLFDELYLRKNRRENVILDIDVSEIIYNKQGYIQGFSYNLKK